MEKTVYSGNYIKVTEEQIDQNNWERCYLRDGVIIFAQKENGKFIMINERRPHEDVPVRLRFVAGHIETELSVEENVNKELQEEVGLRASDINIFYSVKASGTVNNRVYFAWAKNLSESKIPNPDGDVIVSIEEYSWQEIMNKFMSDELKWSLSTLGFLRLYHKFLSPMPKL